MSVSPPTSVTDIDTTLPKVRQVAIVANSAPITSFSASGAGRQTDPTHEVPTISLMTQSINHERDSPAPGIVPCASSSALVNSEQLAHVTTPLSTPVTTMSTPPPARFLPISPQRSIPGPGTPRTTTLSTPASTPIPADAKPATNPAALTLTTTMATLTSPSTPRKSKGGRRAANPNLTEEQRRQERVLKNRESAMKSLQKKKRYTQNLEHRAIALAARNNELRDKIRLLLDRLNSLNSSQAPHFGQQAPPNNLSPAPSVSMPSSHPLRIPYNTATAAAVAAAAAAAAAAIPPPSLKPQASSPLCPSLSSSSLPPPPSAPPALYSSGTSDADWRSGLAYFAHPPPELQSEKNLCLDAQDVSASLGFPISSIPESPCPSKNSSD